MSLIDESDDDAVEECIEELNELVKIGRASCMARV